MGNMDTLSSCLLDLGFFSALGTTERAGLPGGGNLVKQGTPLTWDKNNGVLVVYDERGWPWIRRSFTGWGNYHSSSYFLGLEAKFDLKRGANVPHSNDGGNFLRRLEAELGIYLKREE